MFSTNKFSASRVKAPEQTLIDSVLAAQGLILPFYYRPQQSRYKNYQRYSPLFSVPLPPRSWRQARGTPDESLLSCWRP